MTRYYTLTPLFASKTMPQNYNAPLEEINFLLNDFLGLPDVLEMEGNGITSDVVGAVLEEAAKFAGGVLSPLNPVGDKEGCKFANGEVKTPAGFKDSYLKFIESGWNGVQFPTEYGGQGLPWMVGVAVGEMWNGANMAFSLCPLLTQGAVESILHHGSGEQKQQYLPKLVSGEWTGTMCLTEPQAGSDLAAIRTKATKNGDHYLIKGQKIFITYGEHDFTDNIIHMTLARLPEAPEGVKGISLFIVPKFLADGKRNDVKAISIEHKMGIHASPTCVMSFGDGEGAVGYLVGKENEGLKYMFTMMNNARISVGVEGLGISENSYQQALVYANERVQGDKSAIINHPDVKRMLLTIRAHTEACRAIIYYVARSIDISRHSKDERERQIHQDIVDLLTPVAKAHSTELGFSNASMAMQVFGGVGYIEETGIAQNVRDARIALIYEGTNGIQAMDLVFRKLILHDGGLFESFISSLPVDSKAQGEEAKCPYMNGREASATLEVLKKSTAKIQKLVKENPQQAGMLACQYLRLFGLATGGVFLNNCKTLLAENPNYSKEFIVQKVETVEFYNKYILPEIMFISKIIEAC